MPGPILITGGAGFVGSHVAEALLARGHEVRIVDALLPAAHSEAIPDIPAGAQWLHGDLRDGDVVREAVRDVSAVCHQAAMVGLGLDTGDLPDYVSHNDFGTAVLLAGLARAGFRGRIVLASSMVVYGEGRYRCAQHGIVRPGPRAVSDLDAGRFEPTCPHCASRLDAEPVDESAPVDPRSVYAATKLHQEHLCAAYARESEGVTVTALRYHNVYGARMPRDTPYAGVASIFRSALEAGHPPRVFEDGGQRRDFVDVRDVARANVLALVADRDVEGPLNVASGESHTIAEMAAELHAAASRRGVATPRPVVTGTYRRGDVRHIVASPERAREQLGFTAEVGFGEGMTAFSTAPLRG